MMCRSVFTYQSGAVQAEHYRQPQDGNVMYHVVISPLHEGRIYVAERLQTFFCHTAGECGGVSFGDAYVESPVGHGLHQYVHGTSGGHGGRHPDDFRILLCQFH